MVSEQPVAACLRSCLYEVDPAKRKCSEDELEKGIHYAGFAPTLARIAIRPELSSDDVGVRQLAAVALRQIIRKHWSAEAPKFEAPEMPQRDREELMSLLPQGLSDSSSKIRTAVAMCIAAVQKADPNGWPGLVENLVLAIHTHRSTNPTLVHGAIRCLALISDDIDEQHLPQISQALLPELLQVASDVAGTPEELRAAALSIFNDMLRSLGVISGVYQRQVRDLLVPLVQPWLPLLCSTVAQPLSVQETSGWSVRMLCLKALTQLVTYFSKALQESVPSIMQAAWAMYTVSLALYQSHLVADASEGGDAESLPHETDADGDTLDLESMLSQLFELLISLVGLSRFSKLVRPALPEMAHLAVAYMQMTAAQVSDWSSNPAQYVADEEDSTFTVRVSGELLIDTLLQAFGLEAAVALLDAVEARLREAGGAQAAGQAGWWRLREAALLALGCSMTDMGYGEGLGVVGSGARQRAAAAALRVRAQKVVDEVLTVDLQAGAAVNPLLVGRIMWLAARLQPLLREDQRPVVLAAAAAGLNSDMPAPVKIGACRALAALAPHVPTGVLSPMSDSLYAGLLRLLASGAVAEDALNLVLESMVPLIRADPAATARILPALSTPVLQVWSSSVSDPLVSQAALDVLEALACTPECLGPLAQQALPVLSDVVGQPSGHPGALVEGCLELLAKLVRPRRADITAAVAGSCTGPLLRMLKPEPGVEVDSGLAQGASALLVELLQAGQEDFLSWATAPPGPSCNALSAPATLPASSADAVYDALLATTHHLLNPQRDEYNSCLAGDLAHALVRCLPARSAVQPHLSSLLHACCAKLVASNLSPLVGGLVAALSLMVVVGGPVAWLQAVAEQRLVPPGGSAPVGGLEAVLPIMLERQGDVRGRAASRTCCWALLELLRTRHPLLMSFTVRGARLDLSCGVRTRKQLAADGGEQWSQVPVAVRMIAVVAELMVDEPWERSMGDDDGASGADIDGTGDDDGWEDYDDDDEEDEEESIACGADDVHDTSKHQGEQSTYAGLTLSLSGKAINAMEQNSLDSHINRSPTLPINSAVVAASGQQCDGAQGGLDPFLGVIDLQAQVVGELKKLQQQADTSAMLHMALGLLSQRKLQKAHTLMNSE